VSLATAAVPARQRQTVLRAVPYALEEQFAEDVEQLHFAIGERYGDSQVPVAAVRNETIDAWLAPCRAAGVPVIAVIPEPLLLPWEEKTCTLLLDGERAVFRQSRWGGFAVENDLLAPILDRLWNEPDESIEADAQAEDSTTEKPELRVIGATFGADLLARLDACAGPTRVEESDVPALALLAAGYAPGTGINLLQGPYSPKARIGRYLRPWRVAAVLMLALAGIQFAASLVERAQLQARSDKLTADIEAIYRETFPDARRVVNARAQMETRLQALRQQAGGGQNPFLDILAVSGPVLRGANAVTLTGMNYRDGTMSLAVTAGSLQGVDQLREQLLSAANLEVEIQSASSRDGKVNSRLLIKEGTS
jgi:general secretion pathway protein L